MAIQKSSTPPLALLVASPQREAAIGSKDSCFENSSRTTQGQDPSQLTQIWGFSFLQRTSRPLPNFYVIILIFEVIPTSRCLICKACCLPECVQAQKRRKYTMLNLVIIQEKTKTTPIQTPWLTATSGWQLGYDKFLLAVTVLSILGISLEQLHVLWESVGGRSLRGKAALLSTCNSRYVGQGHAVSTKTSGWGSFHPSGATGH